MANKSSDYAQWKQDALVAAGCGGAAAVVIGLTLFVAGNVSGGEARKLLEAIMPSTRFLCSSVMTATATILALMLTLLSLSLNADPKLDKAVYYRLRQIAFYTMLILIAATCFLVVHCVPLQQSDQIPYWWYPSVYYTVLVVAALVSGGVVTIVGMLYLTIRDMIDAVCLKTADHLLATEEDDGMGDNETQNDTQ